MSKDPRTKTSCNDCMWLVYDEEWTCWEDCRGKYKPGRIPKRKRTVDEEIEAIMRKVMERLAGRIEFAVDNNKEVRNLTDEELEEADKRSGVDGEE